MSPPTWATEPALLPLTATAAGVRVAVRLTPRAGRERIEGIACLADGKPVLKIAVAAPPADGHANAALLDLLAREWRLRRSDLAIAAGHKSRNKIVHIAGDPGILWLWLWLWLWLRLGAALAPLPQK